MQWSPRTGETKNQATWAVLVFGVVFDHFASVLHCLFEFGNTDIPNDALVNSVLREFILTPSYFLSNVVE